jgi:DNA-binding MarR family transcriptional regulator
MGNPYVASRMPHRARLPKMRAMPIRKHEASAIPEDAAVAWARRKETIRGALKLFRVLLNAVRRHAEWVEARHGIGGAQLWVLWELGQIPGARAVDLAKTMAVHRQTVESLLGELLGKGLVTMGTAADAQSSVYFLTAAGQHIADASPEYGQGVFKAALEGLPDSALEQVVAAMRSITESLPFREDRAALKPLADILRPTAHEPVSRPAGKHRQANQEN